MSPSGSSASAIRTASVRSASAGSTRGGWVLASETPALDVVGAHFVREVEPGEMVVIDEDGPHSWTIPGYASVDPKLCLFEFVYFARPDSRLYGQRCTRRAAAWASCWRSRRPSTPTW